MALILQDSHDVSIKLDAFHDCLAVSGLSMQARSAKCDSFLITVSYIFNLDFIVPAFRT